MRPCFSNRIRAYAIRGLSLVEISIVSGLLLLISGALFYVLTGAIQFYHATNATIDAQQGVLLSLNRLSQELNESHYDSVTLLPNGRGIMFASPRDSQGNIQFDPYGRLLWQKYVCYTLTEVGPPDDLIPALIRKEVAMSSAVTSLPRRCTTPLPDFLNLPGDRQVSGRYVTTFEATEAEQVVQAESLENTFGSKVLKIRIDASTTYRSDFSVEAETSVLLKT